MPSNYQYVFNPSRSYVECMGWGIPAQGYIAVDETTFTAMRSQNAVLIFEGSSEFVYPTLGYNL